MATDDEWDDELDDDASDGRRDGKCQACDAYGPVDDISLCDECGPRVERDLIRRRAWDYTPLAFARSDAEREKVRDAVIRQYGGALEIIAPDEGAGGRRRGGNRAKRGR